MKREKTEVKKENKTVRVSFVIRASDAAKLDRAAGDTENRNAYCRRKSLLGADADLAQRGEKNV